MPARQCFQRPDHPGPKRPVLLEQPPCQSDFGNGWPWLETPHEGAYVPNEFVHRRLDDGHGGLVSGFRCFEDKGNQ